MNFFRKLLMVLGVIFIVIVLGAGVYFYMQVHTLSTAQSVGSAAKEQTIGTDGAPSVNTNSDAAVPSVAETVPAAGFTVAVSSLPASQQSVVRSMGFTDTITFTPAMITCAEGKLGVARVEAIRLGAAPTMLESASLLGCM